MPVCAQPAPHGSESAGLRAATPGGPPGGGRPRQSVRRAASVGSLGPQAPARGSERWTAGDAGWAPPTPFREEGQSRALENSAPRAGALWPGLVLAPSPRCHLLRGLRSFPWVLPGLSVSRPGLLWIPWPITLSQTPHCFAPLSSHLSCLAAQVSTFCLVLSLETACRLSPASRVASQPDLGAASFLLVPLETFSSLHLFSDFCPTSSLSLSANGLAPRFSKKIEITKMTASYFRSPSAVLLSR